MPRPRLSKSSRKGLRHPRPSRGKNRSQRPKYLAQMRQGIQWNEASIKYPCPWPRPTRPNLHRLRPLQWGKNQPLLPPLPCSSPPNGLRTFRLKRCRFVSTTSNRTIKSSRCYSSWRTQFSSQWISFLSRACRILNQSVAESQLNVSMSLTMKKSKRWWKKGSTPVARTPIS